MLSKFKKNKKVSFFQDLFFSVFIVIFILLVAGFLIITNWKINKKRAVLTARIESLRKEIQILEEKNKELKEGISQSGSEEYLEKVAREQLGLKAPGEEVFVINKEGKEEQPEIKQNEKNFWNPKGWWEWLKSKF